jgi:hypothetical protein
MRRYYTLESATEKAYKEQKCFQRDNNTSFVRDSLNLARMFFGYEPKFYYFDKPLRDKERERYEQKLLEARLKLTRDDYNESDNKYRW